MWVLDEDGFRRPGQQSGQGTPQSQVPVTSLETPALLCAAELSWTMLSDLALNLSQCRHQQGARVHSAPWATLATSGSQSRLPVA